MSGSADLRSTYADLIAGIGRISARTNFVGRLRRAFLIYWIPLIMVALLASIATAIAQVPSKSLGLTAAIGAILGPLAFGIATTLWQQAGQHRANWEQTFSVSAISIAGILADQSWLAVAFVAYAAGVLIGNALAMLCVPITFGSQQRTQPKPSKSKGH